MLRMTKIIKNGRKIKIDWIKKEYTMYRSRYYCGGCGVTYETSMAENVSRFICECGQEYIIENKHPECPKVNLEK